MQGKPERGPGKKKVCHWVYGEHGMMLFLQLESAFVVVFVQVGQDQEIVLHILSSFPKNLAVL